MTSNTLSDIPERILDAVSKYVQGREELIQLMTTAFLAGGHVLLEGLPGTAKTMVARSFAAAIGGEFRRVQLTPDLLPGDVTGFELFQTDGQSRFVEGPLFANVVLADELNRTTPRTQSAFLEAMQETQVTVDGRTRALPDPFFFVASQIPSGAYGTYPLTEVQADRFMLRLWSGYPEREVELRILEHADSLEDMHIDPVTSLADIRALRAAVKEIHVSEPIRHYMLDLADHIRKDPDVLIGPGPRSALAIFKCSRAIAYLDGRDFALPDDARRLAFATFEHRVRPTVEAGLEDVTPEHLVQRALDAVPVPKGDG